MTAIAVVHQETWLQNGIQKWLLSKAKYERNGNDRYHGPCPMITKSLKLEHLSLRRKTLPTRKISEGRKILRRSVFILQEALPREVRTAAPWPGDQRFRRSTALPESVGRRGRVKKVLKESTLGNKTYGNHNFTLFLNSVTSSLRASTSAVSGVAPRCWRRKSNALLGWDVNNSF